METRANYILIGAFTIAGILAVFGFLLWLAKAEVNRQYSYYDILFSSVSGLGTASDVRFNGLPVGQVLSLELDDEDPSQVRVRIEVAAETPVKTDTEAQLQAQGVTGVSYVALSGGTPGATDLPEGGVIPSRRSTLQSVFEGAPEVLDRAVELLEDLQMIANAENRAAVGTLLSNLAEATGRLDRTLADFEALSSDLGAAARRIAAFTDQLDRLADTADQTLSSATETLDVARQAAGGATQTLETARSAFATADGLMQNELSEMIVTGRATLQTLDTTVNEIAPAVTETVTAARDLLGTRLPGMTEDMQAAAVALETQLTALGAQASALMAQYADVGAAAQARLEEGKAVLAAFERTGTEAQAALSTINATVQQDLPVLFDELRAAARNADRVIAEVGGDVSDSAARLTALSDDASTALRVATDTFEVASETLAAITDAMGTAETTLGSAEDAFSSINRIVDEDLDTVAADVRNAVDVFSETMTSVATSADQISGEILSASRSASELLGTVDGIVQRNERQASDFLRVGLPQFQRFIEESRRLVVNLERLVDRVERDPARFLLGTQASEFNR